MGKEGIEYWQMKTLDTKFKGSAAGPITEVIYANQLNYKNFTFNILPEKLFSYPVAMFFPKNHYLIKYVENSIGHLQSAGLVHFWMSRYFDFSILNYAVVNTDPKKMTFDHLSGIFIIWLSGCIIACVCFSLEIVYGKLRKYLFILTCFKNLKCFLQ